MEHVEYVYTFGMTEAEADRRLREAGTAVLALADGGETYAVPVNYHYDGTRLLVRLAHHPGSDKLSFAEATATASLVVYEDPDPESSWSVVVRGPLRELSPAEQPDEATLNELFEQLRVFDEPVDEVEPRLYELAMREVTGRTAEK